MTNPNHTDTSRSGDLKPCPFCAGDAEYFYRKNTGAALHWCNPTDHWVGCVSDCGALTSMHGTKDEAIAAWNTRPADRIEALEAEVERLRARLAHAEDDCEDDCIYCEERRQEIASAALGEKQ